MVRVFSGATKYEAWLNAAEYLLDGSQLDVVLEITSPGVASPGGKAVTARLNGFYASEDSDPLHTIAETIFPGWDYSRRGARGVFEVYPARYKAIRLHGAQNWGTYAMRMLRRRTGDGAEVNPLEILITKMRDELQPGPGGTKTACYEIGVAEGEFDLPLYATTTDQKRRLGLPCLSHVSFKVFERRLHLTALYRSHDYRYKVPGNLLGLARLQDFVSKQVGIPLGSLVVHSTYAWVAGHGHSLKPFRSLLEDLRTLVPSNP